MTSSSSSQRPLLGRRPRRAHRTHDPRPGEHTADAPEGAKTGAGGAARARRGGTHDRQTVVGRTLLPDQPLRGPFTGALRTPATAPSPGVPR
jgi:hypothetical protein